MPKAPPHPPNIGKPLSNSVVRGLLRAMISTRPAGGRAAEPRDEVVPRGPVAYFSSEQMRAIAIRLEHRAEAGKVSTLKPATAAQCARGLRMLASRPAYEELLAVICGARNCASRPTCFTCRGKANMIVAIFEGHVLDEMRGSRERTAVEAQEERGRRRTAYFNAVSELELMVVRLPNTEAIAAVVDLASRLSRTALNEKRIDAGLDADT